MFFSRKKDISGKTAVVTGASSGIGLCFCRELASRGCNLVMVSNQKSELEHYSSEIARQYGVRIDCLELDLCVKDVADRLRQFLESRAIKVDILINNAGIFSFRPVEDLDVRRVECYIDLHVRAVTMLSREFARLFRNQGNGMILNMSSMSCWMPMPGIAMYSATKAYIRVFSRALHYEMRDYGVSVTVACPGGIATDLFGLPSNLQRLAVRIKALDTPRRFARKCIDRMLAGKAQYINGLLNRISIVAIGCTPGCVRMLVKRKMLDKGIVR